MLRGVERYSCRKSGTRDEIVSRSAARLTLWELNMRYQTLNVGFRTRGLRPALSLVPHQSDLVLVQGQPIRAARRPVVPGGSQSVLDPEGAQNIRC